MYVIQKCIEVFTLILINNTISLVIHMTYITSDIIYNMFISCLYNIVNLCILSHANLIVNLLCNSSCILANITSKLLLTFMVKFSVTF